MSPSDADPGGRGEHDGDAVDRGDRTDRSDADQELSARLDELEAALSELRADLRPGRAPDDSTRGSAARRAPAQRPFDRFRPGSDPGLPRPPSPGQFLRFTEQYTLPTLISILDATIQALELLRGTLRLVDPDRQAFDAHPDRRNRSSIDRLSGGVAGVGREAVSGVERALSELETALSATDIPEDRASDELLADVRDLSAEISERLEEARQATDADRYGYRRDRAADPDRSPRSESENATGGVAIEVGGDDPEGESDADQTDETANSPDVDVEAELETIRNEVRDTEDTDSAAAGTSGSDEPDAERENEDTGKDSESHEPGADSESHEPGGDGGSDEPGEDGEHGDTDGIDTSDRHAD